MNRVRISVGLLAIVLSVNASAAEFCVDEVNALQSVLNTAASNGEDDHIMLVQGTYDVPPGGLDYIATEARELKISGGWVGICLGRSSDFFLTVLSGRGADRVLEIDAGPSATVTIEQLFIVAGSASIGAGILIQNTGEVLLERNAFFTNVASLTGSAVYVFGGDRIRFLNNLFSENHGTNVVDVEQLNGTGLYFIGNTVSVNTAPDNAAVRLDLDGTSSVLVANNILWNNDGIDLDLSPSTGDIFYWHNNVTDYSGPNIGVNNLSVDPQFMPALGAFELTPASPLIDMGIEPPDTVPIPTPFEDNWWLGVTDLGGNDRVQGLTIDIGAFEVLDGFFASSFGDN